MQVVQVLQVIQVMQVIQVIVAIQVVINGSVFGPELVRGRVEWMLPLSRRSAGNAWVWKWKKIFHNFHSFWEKWIYMILNLQVVFFPRELVK